MKHTLVLALTCTTLFCATSVALADPDLSVPNESASSVIPRVLSPEDVRLYRSIFAEERSGKFAAARKQIEDLSDRSLMGYLEAEHYLSPRARRTPLAQLAEWLEKYDELPIAARIHELAEKRNRHHRVELASAAPVHPHGGWGYESSDTSHDIPLSSDAARSALTQIEADVRIDQPPEAEAVLQSVITAGGVPNSDIVVLTRRVSASYLAEGLDADALRVATSISGTDRQLAPLLDWDAGLAAYRLGKFDDSAAHFEALAEAGNVSSWARSAGAFWAARAHLQAQDPLRVVSLLTAAAREQPTFYGMLAQRMLGLQSQTHFEDPVLDEPSFHAIMQSEAAHRGVALWQIGEMQYVEPEMLRAYASLGGSETSAFAALAHRMDLPDLELRASEAQASRGVMLTGLFPMPRFTPPGGYRVDPCLVLAFARVESRFESHAVSATGARGVMQIMPGTAEHVDGAMPARAELNNPAYSLGLGQKYLEELLSEVDGNLFQLAAAYNAGPGSLTHWVGAHPSMVEDPLLFIESIPVAETRNYIKRVMTFYWLYDQRAGKDAPSLQQSAEGKWPTYRPHEITPESAPAVAGTTLVSDASLPH